MSDASDMTPEEVVTEISMSEYKSRAAILLVEGATDAALYCSLFNELHAPSILIQATGSRSNLEGVIALLNSNDPTVSDFPKAIGIADRDYTQPLNLPAPQGVVFLTDARDIECMMVSSEALRAVCDEYIDWTKAQSAKIASIQDLRTALTRICVPLGQLRFWSQHSGKHFKFKKLDVGECLQKLNLALEESTVLNKLRGAQDKGNSLPSNAFEVAKLQTQTITYFNTDWLICRGHDLTFALAALLRKRLGNSLANEVDGQLIERCLRLAYPRFWLSTQLISSVRAWFNGNQLGHVLA